MKHVQTLLSLTLGLTFVASCAPTPQTTTAESESQLVTFPGEEEIVSHIAQTSFPDRTLYFRTDTQSISTDFYLNRLQTLIDSCSLSGGGHVVVASGIYPLNGALHLRSNVDLHLDEGAQLLFSGRPDDFLPVVLTRWEGTELYGRSPMIYTYHAQNVAITGAGIIDAQAGLEFASWGPKEMPDVNRLRAMGEELTPVRERVFGAGTGLRPSCIQFLGCSRVLIEGITIKDSPFWTIHPVYCDNVIVRGVTIDSHFANNDGCDPESTSNVLIENCTFRTGDDAIAIKAGRDADGRAVGRPSERIVIRNCKFYSECNGLCIGSEMSGGVSDVYMHDIEIGTVKNALYFKSNRDRGGYIRHIRVRNIDIERTFGAILRFETNYFGYRGGQNRTLYEDFEISDVHAGSSDRYAFFMDGYEELPIRAITLTNFHVDSAAHAAYFRCTEDISLHDVTVHGDTLPLHPQNEVERVLLDTY
jgi:polygalacturonase